MSDVITIIEEKIVVITIGAQGPEGIQGVPGTGITDYVTNQNLSGTKNGVNVTFTLPVIPFAGSEMIFFNGVKLKRTVDYSISGLTVKMLSIIPEAEDILDATYFEQ